MFSAVLILAIVLPPRAQDASPTSATPATSEREATPPTSSTAATPRPGADSLSTDSASGSAINFLGYPCRPAREV